MPTFTVRRDANGHACAIERDGQTILHLAAGSERNEENAGAVVAALNRAETQPAMLEAFDAAVGRMEAVAEGIPVENRSRGISQATHVRHMAGHLAQHAKIARAAIVNAEQTTDAAIQWGPTTGGPKSAEHAEPADISPLAEKLATMRVMVASQRDSNGNGFTGSDDAIAAVAAVVEALAKEGK